MSMPARCGQRAFARASSFWLRLVLVDSGGAFMASYSAPGGGSGRGGGVGLVGVDAFDHVGQVVPAEPPVEWSRRAVVAVLETGQAVSEGIEVSEVGRFDHFALDDGEDDLDLIQPGRMHG